MINEKYICELCLKDTDVYDLHGHTRLVQTQEKGKLRRQLRKNGPSVEVMICNKCWETSSFRRALKMYERMLNRQKKLGSIKHWTFRAFWDWLQTTNYEEIYANYVAKGEDRKYVPSIDRISILLDYRLGNVQVLTGSENTRKGDARVVSGNLVALRFFEKLRTKEGLTKYEMARKLGMLPQTYYYLEEHARGCSFEILTLLKTKLNLSWETLGQLIETEVTKANGYLA